MRCISPPYSPQRIRQVVEQLERGGPAGAGEQLEDVDEAFPTIGIREDRPVVGEGAADEAHERVGAHVLELVAVFARGAEEERRDAIEHRLGRGREAMLVHREEVMGRARAAARGEESRSGRYSSGKRAIASERRVARSKRAARRALLVALRPPRAVRERPNVVEIFPSLVSQASRPCVAEPELLADGLVRDETGRESGANLRLEPDPRRRRLPTRHRGLF